MKNSRQIIYFAFKFLVFNLIFFFFLSEIAAQQLWQDIEESKISDKGTRYITPDKFRTYALNEEDLKQVLKAAPLERTKAATTNPVYFSMPMPDGTMKVFEIVNSPVMASELAAKYPEIQTYAGYEIDDPENTVRFDLTPQGFHAMIFTREFGTVYIDPYSFDKKGYYIVYKREDIRSKMPIDFECGVLDEPTNITKSMLVQPPLGDCTLRTYRLAIAATGEYTAFHGGTVPLALAAQVTTMNRVNGIYMREMAIFMEIIANNDAIIYTDAATDPYTNGAATTMIGEAQTDCDNNIGNNNYDIGHVFGTTGGGFSGFASIGVTCLTGSKGRGVSTAGTPVGDLFDAYLVPHEMGHQFGANHTFNNACDFGGGPNRNNGTAYEPGAGSTIMAYASTPCTPAYQAADDDYFHVSSLEEISNTILGTSCATLTALANTAPTVNNVPTGLTIPGGTPFELTANATDPDGDVLTYCWEQMDNEISTQPPDPTSPNGPNFRSNPPVNSPTRYFPNLPDLIASVTPVWEVLATVDRTFNFRVTVRDNAMGGGCAFYEEAVINVDGDSGPFIVQNPNAPGITWTVNANETVTWTVAGTNNAPVNCANVDILLSIDGGLTYPITLATNTPNDGNADVQVPNNVTTTARVKIICSDNVFFDISDNDFTIIPQVIITITCPDDVTATCAADVVAGIADLQTDCPTGGGNVAVTGPVVNGNPDCPGTTHIYTFTGTDNCGGQVSCTQIFNIVNDVPTITCPADAVVPSEADIVVGTPTFTTSCGLNGTPSVTGPVIAGNTYTYTHTVTDDCGRTASCQQVFTIQDNEITITCPDDVTATCAADVVAGVADLQIDCPTGGANVEVTGPVVNGNPDCPGTTHIYTFTGTDNCGGQVSCTQIFNIVNDAPTITCPADAVVPSEADIVVGTPTFTTSCGLNGTPSVTGPVIAGNTYTYTHTVTDDCGRTASCQQVFTIQDNEITITCPDDVTATCAADVVAGVADLQIDCPTGGANVEVAGPVVNGNPDCPGTTHIYTFTGTDNCGGQVSCTQIFNIVNDAPTITCPADAVVPSEADIVVGTPTFTTSCGLNGTPSVTGPVIAGNTYTYTHTVTDDCGRTASCQQVFTIQDNEITITCPDDVTATCAADVVAGVADLQTNCPTGGGNVAVTGPVVNGNPDCPGTTHTYTFTGTDNCGQTTSCTQVFTIVNNGPIITECPAAATVACVADIVPGTPIYTTSCNLGATISITGPVISSATPDCPGTTYTYTHIVTDVCGRTASCEQVFTIQNDAPTISCPADAVVFCAADIVVDAATYTVSCGVNATLEVTGPVILGTPDCPGTTYTYTHTVTDVCGRTASCQQVFTIQNAGPTITCPAGGVVACAANIVVGTATYTVSCGVDATLNVTGPVISDTPDCPGTTYTYTHTVTDVCGRTASCEQVFTIQNAGPTISCPAGDVVSCETEINVGTATYTVSCGMDATLTRSGPVMNGDPHCDGTTYTYTHTVTDACGRTASCEQVFTISNECEGIDFNDLPAGTIVSDQYPGVTISTNNPYHEPAMIFDTGNPTGNDYDLGTPNQAYGGPGMGTGFGNTEFQGNALIVSKDRNIPNETEGKLIFEFDCPVIIRNIDFLDMECDYNTVKLYDADYNLIEEIDLPDYGENSFHTEEINVGGVSKMVVNFPCAGGAITNLKYCKDNTPGALCGVCDEGLLNFSDSGVYWSDDATSGTYTAGYQTFDIDISDADNILEDTNEDNDGLEIGIDPYSVTDEVRIIYTLAEVASHVIFDIVDLDYKNSSSSKQQEAVCVYGLLGGSQVQIMPTITSLNGSVSINGNCAEATANSASSGDDESILVTFDDCIDQIVIEYGTGSNSPTVYPSYSSITIGKDYGFYTQYCEGACTGCTVFGDFDGDGVCNDLDICMTGDDNADADGDGLPDACDGNCDPSNGGGDADSDGVCDDLDICPNGNDNIDENNNGIPDACDDVCVDYVLDFSCENGWADNATSGSYTVGQQTFNINADDNDNILVDTEQEGFGINVGIDPETVDDEVVITYTLSEVSNHVVFDIVDLDYKNSGSSKQQEAVCVYGLLGASQVQIMPIITSLDGSVSINGNCAEATTNSATSGDDESILVTFDECIDQVVIVYGTGSNSPTVYPSYSSITIGQNLGMSTQVCESACVVDCGSSGDDDNDGVCNDQDICPNGDDNADVDGDGTPDACDEDCASAGDDDNDGVCNDVDQCPGGNDNIDDDNNGIPDACDVNCDQSMLDFSEAGYHWNSHATSGNFTAAGQTYDINITDADNILEYTGEDDLGIKIAIDPDNTSDELVMTYQLSAASDNVVFDIVDLDRKTGGSKQQEAVCVYGLLGNDLTEIMPVISQLDGSVAINGNCAEATANSSYSGDDESVLITFTDCIDQVVIVYGTGSNSPANDPSYSSITIGEYLGFSSLVCDTPCDGSQREDESEATINIYPNPTSSGSTISITVDNVYEDADLLIYDELGRLIVQDNLSLTGGTTTYDLSARAFAGGVYFVKIRTAAWTTNTYKLVVID